MVRAPVGGACHAVHMDHPWRVKHSRAHEHLRRFEDDCAAYAEAANVGLEYETDQVAGTIRVRLRADAEPPPSLGATVGTSSTTCGQRWTQSRGRPARARAGSRRNRR